MNRALQMEMEWLVRGYYHRRRAYRRALEEIDRTYEGERRQLAQALLLFLPEMQKMQAVETVLKKYPPQIGQALMQNIIRNSPPEYLNCPMGRRRFYETRRKFLGEIARRLGCL